MNNENQEITEENKLQVEEKAKARSAVLPSWLRGKARREKKQRLISEGYVYSHSRGYSDYYKPRELVEDADRVPSLNELVGPRPASALEAYGYSNIHEAADNTPDELLSIKGVGQATVNSIYNFIRYDGSHAPAEKEDCGCGKG